MIEEIKIPYDFYEKVEDKNYVPNVLYGDSVLGDSIIHFKTYDQYPIENKIEISKLIEFSDKKEIKENGKEYFYFKYDPIYVLSIDNNFNLVYDQVLYLMRHKTFKKIYEIKVKNNSVVVTEDHSIIVYDVNYNIFFHITPEQILQLNDNDRFKLIYYDGCLVHYTDDYQIIDIGHTKEYVYDVATKETHRFFANDILVHNTDSLFLLLKTIDELKKEGYEFKDKESIDKIFNEIVAPTSKKINEVLIDYWNKHILPKCNVDTKYNTVDFKTEMLISDIIFTGVKKRYIYKLWKKEDAYYIPPKIKFTGIELKRSDTASITKYAMMGIIEIILKYDDKKERINKAKKLIKEIKNKFEEAVKNYDFEEIGVPSQWSLGEYKSEPSYVLGARLYNTIISDTIRPGTKGYRIAVEIDEYKIRQFINENKISGQYILKPEDIRKDKITFFFIPPEYDKNKIIEAVNRGFIHFLWDIQYDKVIKEKLDIYIQLVKK